MKTISITRLCKDVEYTMNKDVFELRLKYKKVPDKYISILWKFYYLIKFTDFAPDRMRDLFSRSTTYQDVADKYEVSLGAIKTEVFLFTKSVSEIFPIDFIDMIKNGEELDETYYKYTDTILGELIQNSKAVFYGLQDSFTVNIFEDVNIKEDFSNITDDDYLKLRSKLVIFSKPSQDFIYENMDKNLLNYGAYLLCTKDGLLSDKDKERKEDLLKFTKLEK